MKIPKQARRLSRELFRASLTNGRPDEQKIRAVLAAVAKHAPRYGVDVLRDYSTKLRLLIESRHAIIESAADLDAAESASIIAELRSKYGADLTTEFKTNPDLIGGLRVRVGSDVWDGSIREKLSRLASQL